MGGEASTPHGPYALRPVAPDEEALVFSFLTIAARMAESDEPIQQALVDPALTKYWRGWGRADDLGVVVERATDRVPVACAWVRRFARAEAGAAYVDEDTLELALGTIVGERGHGLGGAALAALIDGCRPRCAGLVLSVRANNPAVRLYERAGFTTIAEIPNRVGTVSLTMGLRFAPDGRGGGF